MKTYQSVEAAAKAAGPADRVYWRHHLSRSWEDIEYVLCPAGEEDELEEEGGEGEFHLVSDEEVEACLWEVSIERQALID